MRNPISVLAAALVLGGALLAGSARADVIYLTNGRSLRGRITIRSGGMTTIQLDSGGRIVIPSEQIESVEPMDAPPARAPVVKPVEPPPEAKPAQPVGQPAPGEAGEGPDLAEIQRRAAELAPRIKELIEQLGTEGAGNGEKRVAAREELAKMGEPAAELLAEALRDQSPLRRELAAGLLEAIDSKRAAKPLLKALDEATPQGGAETLGNILVLNAMAAAFNKITGQYFPYDAKDIEDARIVIGQMQAWWQEHAEKFPAQIGDPPREEPKPGKGKAPESAGAGAGSAEGKPAAAGEIPGKGPEPQTLPQDGSK